MQPFHCVPWRKLLSIALLLSFVWCFARCFESINWCLEKKKTRKVALQGMNSDVNTAKGKEHRCEHCYKAWTTMWTLLQAWTAVWTLLQAWTAMWTLLQAWTAMWTLLQGMNSGVNTATRHEQRCEHCYKHEQRCEHCYKAWTAMWTLLQGMNSDVNTATVMNSDANTAISMNSDVNTATRHEQRCEHYTELVGFNSMSIPKNILRPHFCWSQPQLICSDSKVFSTFIDL